MRLAALLFVVLAGCGCAQRAVPTQNRLPQIMRSVVALVNEDGRAYCTGTVVRRGVLTAAHCVEGEEQVRVADLGDLAGRTFSGFQLARVLRRDSVSDLALLEYRRGPALEYTAETPPVGADVWSIGMPTGIPFVVKQGHVASFVRRTPTHAWFYIDVGLIGGMSGGPVIDSTGRIVGVNSATPIEWIRGGLIPSAMRAPLGEIVAAESVFLFLRF